jgi:hypothetical protein
MRREVAESVEILVLVAVFCGLAMASTVLGGCAAHHEDPGVDWTWTRVGSADDPRFRCEWTGAHELDPIPLDPAWLHVEISQGDEEPLTWHVPGERCRDGERDEGFRGRWPEPGVLRFETWREASPGGRRDLHGVDFVEWP